MNERRVLILGITGMVGSHFADYYEQKGFEVFGVARSSAASRMSSADDSRVIRCDILDRDALMKVFQKVKPDLVIHMAAQAFNGTSWEMEYLTHQTNIMGTLNVLRCTRELSQKVKDIKLLLACSSAEYGNVSPDECPITEDQPLRPHSPYGVSKVAVEQLGYQYHLNYGLKIFLPRMFIHVGTNHPPYTAIQNFARQFAMIQKGVTDKLAVHVGNLETARDFIDVRDGVAAMGLMIDQEVVGQPLNICTGKAYKIREVLRMLNEISGIHPEIVTDKNLFRPADEPLLLGDNTKLLNLGFVQKYELYETLESVYQNWLTRI